MAQPQRKPTPRRRPKPQPVRVATSGELWDVFVIWRLGPGLSLAQLTPKGVA